MRRQGKMKNWEIYILVVFVIAIVGYFVYDNWDSISKSLVEKEQEDLENLSKPSVILPFEEKNESEVENQTQEEKITRTIEYGKKFEINEEEKVKTPAGDIIEIKGIDLFEGERVIYISINNEESIRIKEDETVVTKDLEMWAKEIRHIEKEDVKSSAILYIWED